MSEKELNEFKALESRLRSNITATLYKITLGSLGAILGLGILALMSFTSLGKEVTKNTAKNNEQDKIIVQVLDNSDIEIVARTIGKEEALNIYNQLKPEIDGKADKSAFDQFNEKLDIIITLQKNKDNE